MRVKLLNNGGFEGLEKLDYNTVFIGEGFTCSGKVVGVEIVADDLVIAGADKHCLAMAGCKAEVDGKLYFSLTHNECVVVEE